MDEQKKYYTYKQIPSNKFLGHCKISLNERGDALAITDDLVTDRLRGARVQWMAADGIMIAGFEETGFFPDGRPVLQYQEWFCRYYET